jgi:hypothetical protein
MGRLNKDDKFCRESGYARFIPLCDSTFCSTLKSENILVTGLLGEGKKDGRSDPHLDSYDNVMMMLTGSKQWALARLTPEEVARAGTGRLFGSLAVDAIQTTRNKDNADFHEIAAKFVRVTLWNRMVDGRKKIAMIYVPNDVWHAVQSSEFSAALTRMYAS